MARRRSISATEQVAARVDAQRVAVEIADALEAAAHSIRASTDPRNPLSPNLAAAIAHTLRATDKISTEYRKMIIATLADVHPFDMIARIAATSTSTVARTIRTAENR